MDEANFVQAALGGGFIHQAYVAKTVFGIPVLVIPYIGVVKSALFAPIFAIWGVSVETIRIPAIALSAATLVVAYFMGREVIGRWSAILVVLMGTCPTFIFMSKMDWGPNVVGIFLTVSLLLSFLRYLNTGRIAWLWTVFLLALIGIFDKQNFVWLVIAVGVGGAVVYRRRLWELATARPRATAAAAATFVVALLVFGWTLVLPNLSNQGSSALQEPFSHLVFAWGLYERTVGYSELINWFTYQNLRQPAWMDLQWVFALSALGVLALRRRRGALPDEAVRPAKAAVFFFIVFVVMIFEVAATKQATGSWHVIELMPYPVLVLLCSLVAVIRSGISFRRLISAVTATGLCLILAAQVVSTTHYVWLMQNPNQLLQRFSTDVYKDAAFLNANVGDVDEVVSAGWGPGTPLFSLACPADRQKYNDDLYWSELTKLTPSTATGAVRQLFGNRRIFLVYNVDQPPSYLNANSFGLSIAYHVAFPDRRFPEVVLHTQAYDILYFGPHPFHVRHGTC
jgi:hypothetical protein